MPVILTPDEVKRLKEITLKLKGVHITNEEAEDQGGRLVRLIEEFYKVAKPRLNTPQGHESSNLL